MALLSWSARTAHENIKLLAMIGDDWRGQSPQGAARASKHVKQT